MLSSVLLTATVDFGSMDLPIRIAYRGVDPSVALKIAACILACLVLAGQPVVAQSRPTLATVLQKHPAKAPVHAQRLRRATFSPHRPATVRPDCVDWQTLANLAP